MRKLWNRSPAGVWSLVTTDKADRPNMNICSYVSAVSMDPKLLMVAVYKGTQTRDNVRDGSAVLMQLLTEDQAHFVRLLGKQSGRNVDKVARLTQRGLLSYAKSLPFLIDAAGYITGTIDSIHKINGDHDLVVIRVGTTKTLSSQPVLTTEYLRQHGYIR